MSTIQNKKIVAEEYPLKDILSNNKYSIDYFQREYRWQKENIDKLIDDLYNAFRADYKSEHSTKELLPILRNRVEWATTSSAI